MDQTHTTPAGPVVAGLDGHEHDDDVIVLAELIARSLNAAVLLAHVVPEPLVDHGTRSYEIVSRRRGRELLAQASAGLAAPADVQLVEQAPPARGLREIAEEHGASVLVLGAAHHGVVGRVVHGSVLHQVASHPPCPLAVAPAGYRAGAALERIGVAYDDTDEAERALALAVGLARGAGAELQLWWVRAPVDADSPQRTVNGTPYSHEQARATLAAAIARLPDGIHATAEVVEGQTVETLAHAVEQNRIDLLVTGSRGVGPVKRLLVGSTSNGLLSRVRCPLLITPARGAAPVVADAAAAPATGLGTVIVGVEHQERGRDAIALGAVLAHAGGRTVLCGVISDAAAETSREQELQRLREDTAEQWPGVAGAEVRVLTAHSPVGALRALAGQERDPVIVLASSHRGPLGRVVPGDTATRLLSFAPCPVAVAPVGYGAAAPERPIADIAVAYDGTIESDRALAMAATVAARAGARVRLYHAMHAIPAGDAWVNFREHMEEFARKTLDAGTNQLPPEVRGTSTLLEGDTATLLAEAAERDGVELLFLGTRGTGPLRQGLFGGAAGALLRSARCPIVIVPRRAADPHH